MISATDQAVRARGRPGESGAVGVAMRTPTTTITRENTWNVVIIKLDLTSPKATLKICKNTISILQ